MLPEPHDPPTRIGEPGVRVGVAGDIACDLSWPVVGIRAERPPAVFRAAVPEAAVDEDRDALASEHDVRASTQFGLRGEINSVAPSMRVQETTHSELGRGVTAAVGLHVPATLGRRCPRGVRCHACQRHTSPGSWSSRSLQWKQTCRSTQVETQAGETSSRRGVPGPWPGLGP